MIDFHKWSKYTPKETNSYNNPRYIDVAALKVVDVYNSFCYAKFNLDIADTIVKTNSIDRKYQKFITLIFFQNSLFYINNCIDYMWQVLYAYCQKDNKELYDHEKFEELCKEKGLDNIVNDLIEYGIALKEDFHKVKKIKADIERKTNDLKIRSIYNHLKHRGTYAIKGLGDNSRVAFEKYGIGMIFETPEGKTIPLQPKPLLYREEIDLNDALNNLHTFVEFFADKFDFLIKQIIPNDFIREEKNGISAVIDCFDLSPIEELLNINTD